MPIRVQRRRTKGWRTPLCTCGCGKPAIYVGRPTKWGNPISFSDVGGQYPSLNDHQLATLIVRDFKVLARHGNLSFPNWRFLGGRRGHVEFTYPPHTEIRAELAGHDLVCWCPTVNEFGTKVPCHADVLLELANRTDDLFGGTS